MDAIVKFESLKRENMLKVVEKFLTQLNKQAQERKVTLMVSLQAKEYLAREGYDSKYGARPLARLIQKTISEPLSRLMLFGDLKDGGNAIISASATGLTVQAEVLKISDQSEIEA